MRDHQNGTKGQGANEAVGEGNRIKVKAKRFRVANNNELKIGPRAICEFSGINWLVIRITTYFIDKNT